MLINVNKVLDEFSKLVKEKKYDGIEYDVWRKLSKDYDILKVTSWKDCKEIMDNVDEQ